MSAERAAREQEVRCGSATTGQTHRIFFPQNWKSVRVARGFPITQEKLARTTWVGPNGSPWVRGLPFSDVEARLGGKEVLFGA